MLAHAGIEHFHLVGHSMGGLTALMLAHEEPERVLSFVDIEGNVAPEDCFLSRKVITHPAARPSTPAPSTPPASDTKSAPARSAASSNRWSSSPTTAAS